MIRLPGALDHFGGRMDPRHVAWTTSELHDLACWLEYAKLTHNDVSLGGVFISPPNRLGITNPPQFSLLISRSPGVATLTRRTGV